ncbi:MAG TPA: GxxExxY protein [Bacteroidia bacterium]|nr:GxxExxY protein [Bacteroidia bacterium]
MVSIQSSKIYTEKDYNSLSEKIIWCCMEVHKELGPGLMESVYEVCVENVMKKHGLSVQRQVLLPIKFKGEKLEKEFIIDMLVNDLIIVEFKSVEDLLPVHEAQLVTYLKLANKKLGLLINFNVTLLKHGIRRKINGNLNSV